MHRIDSTHAEADKHGAGKNGWTEGDPVLGIAATETTEAWMDAVQEELATTVEHVSAVVKADNGQLLKTIQAMLAKNALANINEAASSYVISGGTTAMFALIRDGVGVAIDSVTPALVMVGASNGVGATWASSSVSGPGTWLLYPPASLKNVGLNAIAHGNGLYVAVGNKDGTDAYILSSPDTTSPSERANPSNLNLYDVMFDGTYFYAVGYDGTTPYFLRSTDGFSTITNLSSLLTGSVLPTKIAGEAGNLVLAGVNGFYHYDGSAVVETTITGEVKGLDFSGGVFTAAVRVSSSSYYLRSSTDGVAWGSLDLGSSFDVRGMTGAGGAILYAVTDGAGYYCPAVGFNGLKAPDTVYEMRFSSTPYSFPSPNGSVLIVCADGIYRTGLAEV
jgi:hypothetical protein